MITTLGVFSVILFLSFILYKVPLIGSGKEWYGQQEVTFLNKVTSVLIPIIVISTLIGFRYNVGVDYPVYKEIYEDLITDDLFYSLNSSGVESIYTTICVLLHKLNIPYYGMFWVMTMIPLFFYYASFKRMNFIFIPATFFLYAYGTFFWYMNIMRQGISFFILLFAVQFIIQRSLLKYIFWVIIASGFHITALLFLPMYFLTYTDYPLLKRKWAVPCYLVTWILSDTLVNVMFWAATPFVTGDYIRYYYVMQDWKMTGGTGLGVLTLHIADLFLIYLSYICLNKFRKERFDVYYNLFLIGAMIANVAGLNMILSRVPFCFLSMRIIVAGFTIWYTLKCWKTLKTRYKLAVLMCILCGLAYLTGNIISTDYSFISV